MQNPKIVYTEAIITPLLDKLKIKIKRLSKQKQRSPQLAIIQIGANKASTKYVNLKIVQCNKLGIKTIHRQLPPTSNQKDIIIIINNYNLDNTIDGIIIQLPLPKHLSLFTLLNTIAYDKDIDALSNKRLGNIFNKNSAFLPATINGIKLLFQKYQVDLQKHTIAILGQGIVVGHPLVTFFITNKATVISCNQNTKNIFLTGGWNNNICPI